MAPNKELTEKEHKLLVNAWCSLKTPPEIDWDKFAQLGGYTNPASGRNAMATIRKKMDAQVEADGEQPLISPSKAKANTPKAPRKRKTAEAEGDGEVTPAKVAKCGRKKSAMAVKGESEEAEEDVA